MNLGLVKSVWKLCMTLAFVSLQLSAYNDLHIPDTLSGTNFTLAIRDTFAQYKTGNQTITSGINGATFWGPTIFVNKGDTVHMTVKNFLNDSTTIHWHGMHLPAVMDGGPHQVIPPGTTWQPYWKVTNQAATYWYHPHLHEMTQEHLTKGVGGFLIVRDAEEAALKLPRSYGVDDIPLVLTSRRFDNANQFVTTNIAYGDYMFTNGIMNAQVQLPKQFVRLRVLNAEIERAYNLGFSDNRTFYVIANDGGLLNAPVALTRLRMGVGERYEILVDLSKDAVGTALDLKAFNGGMAFGFPGGEPGTNGPLGSLLNNTDFVVLHINVGAATSQAITTLPTTLANNVYWKATDATVKKTVLVTAGTPGTDFTLDNLAFALNRINKTTQLNDIEQWTVTNNNVFSHAFHIHDVEFKIVARNGNANAVAAYESGWKDVAYLPKGENLSFVARFDDYADSVHPFMYHCHFSNHEDGGMMGQFVVVGPQNTLSVAPTKVFINAADHSQQTLNIQANVNWTLSSDQTWLSLDSNSGSGNAVVTLTATANSSIDSRVAHVSLQSPGMTSQSVEVTQYGVAPSLTLSDTTLRFPSTGGDRIVHLNSNTSWTLSSNDSWCTASASSGTGDSTLNIHAAENSSATNRSTQLTLSAKGIATRTVQVLQESTSDVAADTESETAYTLYPNPAQERIYIRMLHPETVVYYVTVCDAGGRAVLMLPRPELEKGIDISSLASGHYFVRLMDLRTKSITTQRFEKR